MYVTVGDVQSRMPQFTLTATSKPALSDVQVFIDDVEAQFNASVENMGYIWPITGAQSLAVSRTIIAQGVIAMILFARAAAVGGDVTVQSAIRAQTLFDNYLKGLKDSKNPLELVDAVRTGAAVPKPAAGLVRGLATETNDELYSENTEPRTWLDQLF